MLTDICLNFSWLEQIVPTISAPLVYFHPTVLPLTCQIISQHLEDTEDLQQNESPITMVKLPTFLY